MFWLFAALSLLAILAITLSHHGVVRKAGVALLVSLMIGGVIFRIRNVNDPEHAGTRGDPESPATTTSPFPLDAVDVKELRMSGAGAPFELRGTIHNNSDQLQLRTLTLQITRRDCHDDSLDPSGCNVIWQDQHWMAIDVPVASSRQFAATIWAHSPVARRRGEIRDEFTISAASGVVPKVAAPVQLPED